MIGIQKEKSILKLNRRVEKVSEWFDIAYRFVRDVEGKYSNDKDDRGGETQYGISTLAFIDAKKKGIIPESYQSVKDLTPDDAKRIYKSMYWDAIQGDKIAEIDPRLAIAIFDFYVNSKGYAVKELQKIINTNTDGVIGSETFCSRRRISFLNFIKITNFSSKI